MFGPDRGAVAIVSDGHVNLSQIRLQVQKEAQGIP